MTIASAAPPRVAAVVLAAGRSTRMAPDNKLLLRDASGLAMVARVVAACSAAATDRVIVVTGHQAALVADAVREARPRPVTVFVHAPDFHQGLSASLRAGVAALPACIDGALICLGDMPLVDVRLLDRMVAAFGTQTDIVVPVWQGRRGNPVLWGRRFFDEIGRLTGDAGARGILACQGHAAIEVMADDAAILLDIDTPAQAAALLAAS